MHSEGYGTCVCMCVYVIGWTHCTLRLNVVVFGVEC